MGNTRWLFENASDAAWAVNTEQEVVCWNKAAEALLGYSSSEAIGQKCWQLMRGRTPQGAPLCSINCPIMVGALAGKVGPGFDLLVKRRQGQELLVNVSHIPIPPDYQRLKEAFMIFLYRQAEELPDLLGTLCISLLGATTVRRPDGTLVGGPFWQRAKVRALLVYLALKKGQPVSRQELIDVLWSDLGYEQALPNLNTTVYNLRRSLEPDLEQGSGSAYILYSNGFYWLNGGVDHWLDVLVFEDGIRRARLEKNTARAIDIYREALKLYRGEYLADLRDTGVKNPSEQNRLYQLYLSALEELGDLYEKEQLKEEAKALYQKVLTKDPYGESARRKLVSLTSDLNSRFTTLTHCQQLVNGLKSELDALLEMEVRSVGDGKGNGKG